MARRNESAPDVARVGGQPNPLEAFTLAGSEKAFSKTVPNPAELTESLRVLS